MVRVDANPSVRCARPSAAPHRSHAPRPSSGTSRRSARRSVWALGFTGQGVVIGGQDTGYEWDHPALKSQYRGWNGSDRRPQLQLARRDPLAAAAAAAPTRPSRATTTATAPTRWARWWATTAAPTRSAWRRARSGSAAATWTRATARRPPTSSASSGSSRRPTSRRRTPIPAMAPHVINNSWGCPTSRGLHEPERAAHGGREHARGGHRGRRLGRQLRLGLQHGQHAGRHLRRVLLRRRDVNTQRQHRQLHQPRSGDGRRQQPPEARHLGARRVSIRSSVPGSGYASFSGTWMAGPHVAGLVALLISASPELAGNVDAIEPVISASAVPRTTSQVCGGVPGSTIPNNTYGWGRVDALAAVNSAAADLEITQADAPDPTIASVAVTYTLTATNHGPLTAHNVVVTDTFPSAAGSSRSLPARAAAPTPRSTRNARSGRWIRTRPRRWIWSSCRRAPDRW